MISDRRFFSSGYNNKRKETGLWVLSDTNMKSYGESNGIIRFDLEYLEMSKARLRYFGKLITIKWLSLSINYYKH